jgi:hypothetical protein
MVVVKSEVQPWSYRVNQSMTKNLSSARGICKGVFATFMNFIYLQQKVIAFAAKIK